MVHFLRFHESFVVQKDYEACMEQLSLFKRAYSKVTDFSIPQLDRYLFDSSTVNFRATTNGSQKLVEFRGIDTKRRVCSTFAETIYI